MGSRWRALAGALGAVALTAGGLGLSSPIASAQVVDPLPAVTTVVHAIQGVIVDVYASGGGLPAPGVRLSPADGLAPGDVLGPDVTAPGDYTVSVYGHTVTPAPDTPPVATPVLQQAVTVAAGPIDATAAAGLTEDGTPVLFPFVNDVSQVPAGKGRVSLRHTAAAGPVDVYLDGVLVVAGLANGGSEDLLLYADTYSVTVFPSGADPSGTPLIGPADLEVDDGGIAEVYASTGLAGEAPALVVNARLVPSSVTILHAVPDGPDVDVYLDGTLTVSGLEPEATAGPLPLVNTIPVQVFPAGADPETATPLFDGFAIIDYNGTSTLVVHLDDTGAVTASTFANELSFPGVGNAVVAFRHTAALGPLDVCVDGEIVSTDALVNDPNDPDGAEFGTVVPAGTYSVAFVLDGTEACDLPDIGPVPVTFAAGTFSEVYAVGTLGPPSTLTVLVRSQPSEQLFNPVTPTRIVDTRDGTGGVGTTPLSPGEVLRISPGGRAGIPTANVDGVALNVTAAEPVADGYLTVFPCTDPEPETSNLNYVGGQIAEPNTVITALEEITGDFCITTYAETDVIVDVFGWFSEDAGFAPLTPSRVADTRNPSIGPIPGPLLPGQILTIQVSGGPGAAEAAALNVTAANTTARGYLTVFPCDGSAPYASSVNYEPGEIASPNAVIIGLDDAGQVCVTTSSPVDVVVDLTAEFEEDSPFVGLTPARIADTRDGEGGVPIGKLLPGETLEVQVTQGDEFTVSGAALNVTATEADGDGYLTVFPCDEPQPYVSNVNYTTERLSSPNAVVTGLADDGTVCITTYAPVHVVVDLNGLFTR